jgi:hypothetical protein
MCHVIPEKNHKHLVSLIKHHEACLLIVLTVLLFGTRVYSFVIWYKSLQFCYLVQEFTVLLFGTRVYSFVIWYKSLQFCYLVQEFTVLILPFLT